MPAAKPFDKRRLLRAEPPPVRSSKCVQVYLSPDEYECLYNMAFDAQRSLADQVRYLINKRRTKGGD